MKVYEVEGNTFDEALTILKSIVARSADVDVVNITLREVRIRIRPYAIQTFVFEVEKFG
jgi:hypothetical protein